MILTLVQPPLIIAPLVFVIIGLATVAGSGVPLAAFGRGLWLPAGFILLGTPVLAFNIDINDGINIHFSPAGAILALETTCRSFAAFSCLLFFSLTTPIGDWAPRLRHIGISRTIIDLLLLTHRSIFLLLHTAAIIGKSQSARLGYGSFSTGLRSSGLLGAALLPLAITRAMRLESGLRTRGESDSLNVLSKTKKNSPAVYLGTVFIVFLLALLGNWPAGGLE